LIPASATICPTTRIARPQGRARIETGVPQPPGKLGLGIARPQGRARIETIVSLAFKEDNKASPGLKAGRGLKLRRSIHASRDAGHRPASRPGAD